ncbi:acetate uptake transporter [Carboxylicivirga sediminis]|uniref:Acetate uptake transporter n=1 Tax=Carboxylicivirga sediminis TaxID=2006564 RepID=A0A941F0X9_9BACT|nr:acetate uptake transporter [Carboxylicivirga sediminis]MBR8534861.1 acetate uptake transporter [Carboxylicivirga sediminis]
MEQNVFIAKDVTTNPAPLGLTGFGLTTMLLNLHNAGLFGLDTMIMGMGIMMGGLIQILVGMLEWKKNNMFGMMAFTSYGAFWISLVFIWIFPKMGLGEAPSATAMGYYLAVWGIFTFGLWIATLKMTKTMIWLFGTVVVLFALLAIANFTGSHLIHTIAGIEGVICGASALYIAIGTLLVEVYGKQILPMP